MTGADPKIKTSGGRGLVLMCQAADDATKREILSGAPCYLDVEDGHIGSYQWKGPFGVLEMDASGAFYSEW